MEDNSVNEPANSDDKSSHEPSSINKSIFTSCDHAKFEREILQLKEENERLKNTNSKISNSDRDLLLLKKLLIAKIQVNCPTEDEKNLTKLEIDNLFKKYEGCFPSEQRKTDQANVDKQVLEAVKKHPEGAALKAYFKSIFSLSKGQFPHTMTF